MTAQAPYPVYSTRQIIKISLHSLHIRTPVIASAAAAGIIQS
jgi:hypothetical protein